MVAVDFCCFGSCLFVIFFGTKPGHQRKSSYHCYYCKIKFVLFEEVIQHSTENHGSLMLKVKYLELNPFSWHYGQINKHNSYLLFAFLQSGSVPELDMHESKHVLPGQFVHCILLIHLLSLLLCVVFSDPERNRTVRRQKEGKNYVYLFVFWHKLGRNKCFINHFLHTGTKATSLYFLWNNIAIMAFVTIMSTKWIQFKVFNFQH
jgi:hypothetical protein